MGASACNWYEDAGACADLDCGRHGKCRLSSDEAICECDAGYHFDGTTCVDDASDPCFGVSCSGNGQCTVDADGRPLCLCYPCFRNNGPTDCVPGGGCIMDADCVDALACTREHCVDCMCRYDPMPDGTPCDDDDPCTLADVCSGGHCTGELIDEDLDGHPPASCGGDDCDDGNPDVRPRSYREICGDGVDQDCDGLDPECDSWTPTSLLDAPVGRFGHTAVWTGREMVVWGGAYPGQLLDSGGIYDPYTDSWTPTSSVDAPAPRKGHRAIWTGERMIVWGGDVEGEEGYTNTGGIFDPSTNTWDRVSSDNAPTPRAYSSAIWTGSETLIWGGIGFLDSESTGGIYEPSSDTWTPMPTKGAPQARYHHTAVWTGTRMIVWGGMAFDEWISSGEIYAAETQSWSPVSSGAGEVRGYHSAVWAQDRMIVWGGGSVGICPSIGVIYDPVGDAWTPTSDVGAPPGSFHSTVIWTGSEMIVWGGSCAGGFLGTGGIYIPETDSWTPMSTEGAPTPRSGHTAVWTGDRLIIWSGEDMPGEPNSGAVYFPPRH
ncbi:MAG: hypothetical protein JXR96_22825 [Deltaproteobacteria bacterium]|nr:hypothetical protein [Deltaproteobacteria bacterium]